MAIMNNKADVVWWWRGGAEFGEWLPALPGVDADVTAAEIERSGHVCVKGFLSVGPPEGPPSAARLAEAVSLRKVVGS